MMKNRIIWGINDSSHDAALSVVANGKIVFAGHSERYDKIKNSYCISENLVENALEYGMPDSIAYFEKRFKKRARRAIFGGINGGYRNLYKNKFSFLSNIPEVQFSHHASHAAAGYYTSGFSDATVVVVDAIGEFETASIWMAKGKNIKKMFSLRYPTSFGLFYSAFTHLVGLKAGTEEYILMGMSSYGDKSKYFGKINQLFPAFNKQKINFHVGVENWGEIYSDQDRYDIAAAAQYVYELRIVEFMRFAKSINNSNNLVFMGGCALNCKANTIISSDWGKVWIMPNPGDAGSSLGAALAHLGDHVDWDGPYLGKNIEGEYPVQGIVDALKSRSIVAVASGRAEFGPRALGNRSIFADPRISENKDLVNTVKKREKFRPFAPVVMEEHADEWFEMPCLSPYMQFAVRCKNPQVVPAVVHVDGTSRVQTVNKKQHAGLYDVLSIWKEITGIPILLNTSLNIKNKPLLNDLFDIDEWKKINPSVEILH